MERHRGCSGRRAYECRGGYCGLLFTPAGSVRDIAVVKSQRPVSSPSTSRATVRSASRPPPPPHTVNHGNPKEERNRDRGKDTRVGEPPGDRVGTTERGRGRARAWHTRVTARQRQRGLSEKNRQDPQKDDEWEGKQAWEGAQGGETGVARRRAGGTRRARVSSEERDQGGTRKKTKTKIKSDKARKKDKQRGWGRAGGGGSREPTKAQRYTSSRSEKRHADDPH